MPEKMKYFIQKLNIRIISPIITNQNPSTTVFQSNCELELTVREQFCSVSTLYLKHLQHSRQSCQNLHFSRASVFGKAEEGPGFTKLSHFSDLSSSKTRHSMYFFNFSVASPHRISSKVQLCLRYLTHPLIYLENPSQSIEGFNFSHY